jgi:hypothetical protein
MVEESATGEDLHLAASITVRYSKASEKRKADVDVKGPDGREETITAAPADDETVEEYRIA